MSALSENISKKQKSFFRHNDKSSGIQLMASHRRSKKVSPTVTPKRTYTKRPLTVDAALFRLWDRNLIIDNRSFAETAINSIGYFRLSIYMRRFQDAKGKFFPRTKFSDIVSLYEFDRTLRSLTMDGIERLEVSLRAAISNELSLRYDPHWYVNHIHFEDLVKHHSVMTKIIAATDNTKSVALKHYHDTYSEPRLPPIWLTCEKLTFGALSLMFSNLKIGQRKIVAAAYGFPEALLVSWFRSLTDLRNECAHHGRLWRGHFSSNCPEKHRDYIIDFKSQNSFYVRACVMALLLKTMGKADWWRMSLSSLFDANPLVTPISDLGFPADWETRPIWC
jgi:abortive infection bacteriophage resistance protein